MRFWITANEISFKYINSAICPKLYLFLYGYHVETNTYSWNSPFHLFKGPNQTNFNRCLRILSNACNVLQAIDRNVRRLMHRHLWNAFIISYWLTERKQFSSAHTYSLHYRTSDCIRTVWNFALLNNGNVTCIASRFLRHRRIIILSLFTSNKFGDVIPVS